MKNLPNELIVEVMSLLPSQKDYYNFIRVNSRIGYISISFNKKFKEIYRTTTWWPPINMDKLKEIFPPEPRMYLPPIPSIDLSYLFNSS